MERNLFVCNLDRNKEKMKELENIVYLINCAEKACFKLPTQYNNEDIETSLNGLKGMILCSTETLKIKNEENSKKST